MQGAGLSAAINKLHHCPVILHDDIQHLDLTVRKGLAPAVIITPVTFAARQQLAASHVFEMAVFGNHGDTAFRVTQVPGFVENTHNSFRFRDPGFLQYLRLVMRIHAHVRTHTDNPEP